MTLTSTKEEEKARYNTYNRQLYSIDINTNSYSTKSSKDPWLYNTIDVVWASTWYLKCPKWVSIEKKGTSVNNPASMREEWQIWGLKEDNITL